MTDDLPPRIRSRADLERLLARSTNWEELRPRSPEQPAFKLERVRALLASVGDPHLDPRKTVHVAGSKGKGTVVRMTDAVLRATGTGRVGLYTSPHLEDLGERIAVDGVPASGDELASAADQLLPYVRARIGSLEAPTFFELLTAVAWLVFRARDCAYVVLETGLGGRLDATNVCRPDATAITSIELEHTDVLGTTLEAVAGEKAGILKRGVPAATSAVGAALATIEARAREVGAPLVVVGRDVEVLEARMGPGPRTHVRLRFAPGGSEMVLDLPVLGAHHGANAALAATLARTLGVPDTFVRGGIEAVRLPGIVEPLGDRPLVVADGAHTPASAAGTRAAVEAGWPDRPLVLLLAFLEGKDARSVAAPLLPGSRAVVVTRLATPRAQDPADVAARVRKIAPCPVEVEPDPDRALARARALAGPDGLVLATGSVRLAGLVRRHLGPGAPPPS